MNVNPSLQGVVPPWRRRPVLLLKVPSFWGHFKATPFSVILPSTTGWNNWKSSSTGWNNWKRRCDKKNQACGSEDLTSYTLTSTLTSNWKQIFSPILCRGRSSTFCFSLAMFRKFSFRSSRYWVFPERFPLIMQTGDVFLFFYCPATLLSIIRSKTTRTIGVHFDTSMSLNLIPLFLVLLRKQTWNILPRWFKIRLSKQFNYRNKRYLQGLLKYLETHLNYLELFLFENQSEKILRQFHVISVERHSKYTCFPDYFRIKRFRLYQL